MTPPLAIDHAVIAVRDLDAAALAFRSLGFTLTPRGFHSVGSQNHCIMLDATYIELLAAPVEHPWLAYYRSFLERGDGLAALALASSDAGRDYAALREHGVAARPPMDLSRPVEGGIARFRIVQIERTPGCNLFLCQHLTRELVWRPQWQSHDNGAQDLAHVAWGAAAPFEGLPEAIEWRSAPALHLRGLARSAEASGVRLVPA